MYDFCVSLHCKCSNNGSTKISKISDMDEVIKTEFQRVKEAKELDIYNEWIELTGKDGMMKTAVEKHLMEKYGIYSRSTIFRIVKRVERRLCDA